VSSVRLVELHSDCHDSIRDGVDDVLALDEFGVVDDDEVLQKPEHFLVVELQKVHGFFVEVQTQLDFVLVQDFDVELVCQLLIEADCVGVAGDAGLSR